MRGKRVLVTGASSGVGEAAARIFAAEGADVALLARRAERVGAIAAELGGKACGIPVDVSDSDAVASAVTTAVEELGGLDVAINAAAIAQQANLAELTPSAWREMIDINLSGAFYVSREAALSMLAAGRGSIVNVGSDLGSMGHPGFSHYGAAKAGLIGLTKNMAAELAPTVRVNIVCPGPIDTPMQDAQLALAEDPEAARRESMANVPLGRFATPEEIVAAIRLLAVEATFATGAVLPVDGGTTVV
jgi:NAD(P)-dependent dehydrogenase (short-subunit alcohol dehydrogenase family)